MMRFATAFPAAATAVLLVTYSVAARNVAMDDTRTGRELLAIASQDPEPITDFSSRAARTSYSSWFDGCGEQACACGIPPELLVDRDGKIIPHVALNVQVTPLPDASLPRPIPLETGDVGMFHNGKNCGRWIEITFKEDCLGLGLTSSEPVDICGVDPFEQDPLLEPSYQLDSYSGKKLYAVVADSCQDNNFWCRNDVYHLDLQRELPNQFCDNGDDISCFNSRQLSWKFVDKPPRRKTGLRLSGREEFAWFCSSTFPWWAVLIAHNLKNGVSAVTVNGLPATLQGDAGQQWQLDPESMQKSGEDVITQVLTVEAVDVDGDAYPTRYVELKPNKIARHCKTLNASPARQYSSAPPPPPPSPDDSCAGQFQPCGGTSNTGSPNCCKSGLDCFMYSEYHSQCEVEGFVLPPEEPPTSDPPAATPSPEPDVPTLPCSGQFGQCAGSVDAPMCCEAGLICVFQNEYYSQCLQPPVIEYVGESGKDVLEVEDVPEFEYEPPVTSVEA